MCSMVYYYGVCFELFFNIKFNFLLLSMSWKSESNSEIYYALFFKLGVLRINLWWK